MHRKSQKPRKLLPEEIATEIILFESMINEQIAIEEPFAPRVRVIVDKTRSADDVPLWEYTYTNRLL